MGFSNAAEITVEVRDRKPSMWYENGKAHGPLIEVVKEAFKISGHKPLFTNIPWPRTLLRSKNGSGGLALRHSLNKQRAEFMLPIIFGSKKRNIFFLKKKGSEVSAKTYDDLYKLRLGTLSKTFYFERFAKDEQLTKIEKTKRETLIKMLAGGRIDALAVYEMKVIKKITKQLGISFDSTFEPLEYKKEFFNGRYMSIPKKSVYAKYYKDINCSIYEMRRSGKIGEIFRSNGLKPHLQNYDDPVSLQQIEMCQ